MFYFAKKIIKSVIPSTRKDYKLPTSNPSINQRQSRTQRKC